jgi:hypothetical protein
MSKGQSNKINDLEEIIAHLHKEVELKDYWIETFTSEKKYAQSVKDWKDDTDKVVDYVSEVAVLLTYIMDIVEDEGGEPNAL